MRWFLVWVASVSCLAAPDSWPRAADEPDWVAQVFPERSYDFGNVAHGSVVRYAFPIVNRTEFEVRIVDWKTKCGCTNVRVGSKVIPPGTQTTIEATIDTTRFQGQKASGLTLYSRPPECHRGRPERELLHPDRHHHGPGPDRLRRGSPVGKAGDGRSHPDLLRRSARLGNRRHENADGQGQGRRQGDSADRPTGASSGTSPRRLNQGSPTAISRMRSS